MNITTFSDYALRVLIYLAVHDGQKSTTDEISSAYDISFHHVAKAAQWLVKHGYVTSERGRNGGMMLASSPADINIGDVVARSEGQTYLVDCMKPGGGSCCIRPACGLKLALAEAQAAFFETLRKFTLSDVITQKSALSALLLTTKDD